MTGEEETRPLHELMTPTDEIDQTEDPMDTTDEHPTETLTQPDRDVQEVRDVRPVALVLGVLYLGGVATWALAQSTLLGVEDLGVVLPSMLLLAGIVGLVGLATRRRGTLSE
ncbi:hypothetical protein KLP28_04750 [Nocardioidaceae bacterium]|nr:hypothetical protein KLP28_04750 [Nocardioidaceae bacterium]